MHIEQNGSTPGVGFVKNMSPRSVSSI